MSDEYIKPENVNSPKAYVQVERVLVDDGPGTCAMAIGRWEKDRRILSRWNGNKNQPKGMPISNQYPIWYVEPQELTEYIVLYLVKRNPTMEQYIREYLRG